MIDRLLERHFAACDRFVVLEDNMNYVFFALGEEQKVVGLDPRLLRAEAQQASPKCRLELSGRYGQLADLPAAVAQARGRLIESYASEKVGRGGGHQPGADPGDPFQHPAGGEGPQPGGRRARRAAASGDVFGPEQPF